jgi:serine/threonine-protein kinase
MDETLLARLNAALDGRYAVDREIGEGGMATVYLATDLKHNRSVALKVLKRELSAVVGGERFLAEIETTANLQHPHILPLFDSGAADGFLFYVMPYVEGETLAQRLAREKQLPVDEAVRLTMAVASALDYAHRHGVVHRDIKPANILLQDGQPVVSDFGIAIAVGAAGGNRLTETGLSVGTPYYMSPEQATGDQVVGPASDTYSLACVLFEMLVGEPPYLGNTAQAVLGKIIQGAAVSATAMRKSIPLNVDAAIRKGLEKLPADRFTGAHDFARALEDPNFRHGTATGVTDPAAVGRMRWIGLAGWGAAAVLTGLLAWTATRPDPPKRVGRFAIPNDAGAAVTSPGTFLPAGDGMVYQAPGSSGQPMLWVRRWDEVTGVAVRGTEAAGQGRVSPDGTEVAFAAASGELRVAPLHGGSVRTVADSALGAIWSADGAFLYYMTSRLGINRVEARGGEVTVVVAGPAPDSVWVPLSLVPGRDVLLVRHLDLPVAATDTWIEALDLKTGVSKILIAGTSPAYVTADGYLVFGTAEGALMAAPFDVDALELRGAATVMVEGIGTNVTADVYADVAADGSLIYLPGAAEAELTPVWVDRAGRTQVIDPEWRFRGATNVSGAALSPDGTRLAVAEFDDRWNIWVKELDGGPRTRLTVDGGRRPFWSADGQRVYFLSSRLQAGSSDVWSRPSDASRAPEVVLDAEREINQAFALRDGSFIFRMGTSTGGGTDADIFLKGPPGDSAVTTLVDSDFLDWQPALSPDGRWLAYASLESGRSEVYVRPFPDTQARRWQVSVNGGRAPVWSRDGRELFYQGDTDLIAATVTGTPTFAVAGRERLFSTESFFEGVGHALYDVHPDGRRFVFLRRGEGRSYPLILVQNWLEEVAQRLSR